MRVLVETFTAPKGGSAESEYEDAAWPSRLYRASTPRFRCAVADGATETSYSRSWAHILVGAFASDRLSGPDADELAEARLRWQRGVDARLVKPHAWYVDAKVQSGAYAALVTLDLEAEAGGEPGNWASFAIGDSCLVQMRGAEVVAAFPLDESTAFNDRPHLLGSLRARADDVIEVARTKGCWRDRDTFFLLSDAIACWFHKEREAGRQPWQLLNQLRRKDRPGFGNWVNEMRASRALKNDDVTVLRLQLATGGGD